MHSCCPRSTFQINGTSARSKADQTLLKVESEFNEEIFPFSFVRHELADVLTGYFVLFSLPQIALQNGFIRLEIFLRPLKMTTGQDHNQFEETTQGRFCHPTHGMNG